MRRAGVRIGAGMGNRGAWSRRSATSGGGFVEPTGPQVAMNMAEAIVGLLIESLIVAIITRRILGLG